MKQLYLTPTLLNSWQYYINSPISQEEQAKTSFINCLNKVKTEPTPDMIRGLDFEKDVYDFLEGKIDLIEPTAFEVSQVVKGSMFQVPLMKKLLDFEDCEIHIFGIADCINKDTIYDIKNVRSYDIGKYSNSLQHKIYLCATLADKFEYVISDGSCVFKEGYNKSPKMEQELKTSILEFLNWLKINNIFDVYVNLWDAKEKLELMENE